MIDYFKGGIAHKHDGLNDVWARLFREKQCPTNRSMVFIVLNDLPHKGIVNEDVILRLDRLRLCLDLQILRD